MINKQIFFKGTSALNYICNNKYGMCNNKYSLKELTGQLISVKDISVSLNVK